MAPRKRTNSGVDANPSPAQKRGRVSTGSHAAAAQDVVSTNDLDAGSDVEVVAEDIYIDDGQFIHITRVLAGGDSF